jgi:hypothetical protein
MSKIHTAVFLGAGASKAEGAPLQGELFQAYFSSSEFNPNRNLMDRELVAFFGLLFGIDVREAKIRTIQFPTFEEVLGLTDLAVLRKESFRHFDIESRSERSG